MTVRDPPYPTIGSKSLLVGVGKGTQPMLSKEQLEMQEVDVNE